MRLFNLDSPLMQFLTKLTDLVILNLLFLLCCIPIITIGASLTALYTVTLKAAKNEESYITRSFFLAFKNNFKIGTLTWLIVLAIGIILWTDFQILPSIAAPFGTVLQVLLLALSFLYLIAVLYLFPYIARFENTLSGYLKNTFLLAIAYLPYTLLFVAITVLAILATLFVDFRIMGFLWIVIGYSGIAYVNSFFFRKIFAKFEHS